MQVELLDRQRWRTRVELANAIFEYIEIFHNRRAATPRSACFPRFSSSRSSTHDSGMSPVTRLHAIQGTAEPLPNPGRFSSNMFAGRRPEVVEVDQPGRRLVGPGAHRGD